MATCDVAIEQCRRHVLRCLLRVRSRHDVIFRFGALKGVKW